MSKTKYYYQCEMRKPVEHGEKVHTAWIPEKYAVKDKYIKIKWEDGKWEDGWRVSYIGGKREAKFAEERSRDYKYQREESDI
jgi:hypothetical protein